MLGGAMLRDFNNQLFLAICMSRINGLTALPISLSHAARYMPQDKGVTLGIGRAVKRDAGLARVRTGGGLTGWGEARAGRAPGAIAQDEAALAALPLIDGPG